MLLSPSVHGKLRARFRWAGHRADISYTELEQLSEARGGPVARHTSSGEQTTLERLVRKHGEDVEAMARDRKLNVDQRTAGELKRAIRKAGGFAELGKAG